MSGAGKATLRGCANERVGASNQHPWPRRYPGGTGRNRAAQCLDGRNRRDGAADRPAAVEITGTSPAQVINFEIPQGPPGPGAEGINQGTGAEVFAGADPGTGIMEFWRVRGSGVTTTSVNASGVLITTTVTWGDVSGKPSTFPPMLPIAIANVTGLTAQQAAQDTAIGTN